MTLYYDELHPDIATIWEPDQDPMSQVRYRTRGVSIHRLFGCKPLGNSFARRLECVEL